MRYIVGLDFGTHQTKVCIEDSQNPMQIMYEFLEFPGAPAGQSSLLLPSVVQINLDDTVGYGFIDASKVKMLNVGTEPEPERTAVPAPQLKEYPQEPAYRKLPPKPETNYKGYLAVLASLLHKSEEEKAWEKQCAEIKKENENRRIAWQHQKQLVDITNNAILKQYEEGVTKAEADYQEKHKEWEGNLTNFKPLRFRYFKQATYFYREIWDNDFISPECASIWFLAYIRFLLNEKLGKEYIVRMGAPCSYSDLPKFQQRAYDLWAATDNIVSHFGTKEEFLAAKYTELLEFGKYHTHEIDFAAPFDVRTEAQASLFAVVDNNRLDTKINLLYDIGGGSTDVAVFQLKDDSMLGQTQLKILETISLPIGLNHIFEGYQQHHPELSIEEIQSLFSHEMVNMGNSEFADLTHDFGANLAKLGKSLSKAIVSALIARGLRQNNILTTLANNPCVFSGGGAMYNSIRDFQIGYPAPGESLANNTLALFMDKRLIDKSLLGIQNVKNEINIPANIYTILAVAYGLSLNSNFYEVPAENIYEAFGRERNAPIYRTHLEERNDDD